LVGMIFGFGFRETLVMCFFSCCNCVENFTELSFATFVLHVGHLTLLENNPQGLCYCENSNTFKMRVEGCGLRRSANV